VKSAVENISPSRIKITIEMPFAELQSSLDSAYARISSQVNIPGFRKGKIPTRIIDQRVGRGVVLEEAVNDASPSGLAQAMIENKIVQLGRPEVDVTTLDEETGLIFTAELDIRPEFDLPKFDSLKVVVDDAEVTVDQVEEQLTGLRGRFGALKEVTRAAKDGDVLLVDLSGDHDGQVVEELAATAFSYELGSDDMVPGFDDAVRGAKAEEVRHFLFTPSAGQWSGKGITVEVNVKAVRERELPDADDEFAQLASEFDTIGELREDVRSRLGRVRLIEQAYQARDLTHDALMGAVKIDLPDRTIQDEIEVLLGH
jgi:trigger factor